MSRTFKDCPYWVVQFDLWDLVSKHRNYLPVPVRQMLIRADVIFAAGYVRSVPPSDPLVTFALDQHGTDTDPDLDSAKEALAENQSCLAGLLDRLGSDPNRYVRMAVVSNLKCPPAVRGRALEAIAPTSKKIVDFSKQKRPKKLIDINSDKLQNTVYYKNRSRSKKS